MAWCPRCLEILDSSFNICPKCNDFPFTPPINGLGYTQNNLIANIAYKLRNVGTIWAIIGSLQILAGLITVVMGFIGTTEEAYSRWDDPVHSITWGLVIAGILLLLIGVRNAVNAKVRIKCADDFVYKPIDIASHFKRINPIVTMFIVNLLIGAGIGIIGAIYEFFLRNFVLANVMQLNHIEDLYIKRKKSE